MNGNRVGWGFDAHRFAGPGSVLLAGVAVDGTRGVAATSDGDVLAHSVADAALGAVALGDLGSMFPSDDPRWEGADSMEMLTTVVGALAEAGWTPVAVDVTVVAETVRVAPWREAIREALAAVLGLASDAVSVKATSTDGMGFLGKDEGIASVALMTVRPT